MANSSTAVDLEQCVEDVNEMLSQQIVASNIPQPSSFVSAGHLEVNDLSIPPCDIQVDILNLREVYDKIQKKIPVSEQHITDGVVNMVVRTTGQVQMIRVFVQRSPEAAEKVNGKLGRVELNVNLTAHTMYNILFSVDLDSVYKTSAGDKVYWLDKVEVDKRNIWQLIISVELIDGTMKEVNSRGFRIRTKPRESQSSAKRQKSHQRSCASSDLQDSPCSSGSPYRDDSPGRSTRQSGKVLADYLEAQRAQIQHLAVLNTMTTPNADIAYHLKLTEKSRRRPSLEEGDVIGFLTNPSTGETEIEKLSEDNLKQAVMAGVISRSAYLYGNVPEKEGDTDTVCVIGLVKVKVMGTVQNGERIYAALDNPGVAVPETQIPLRRMADRWPTLLGQALESKTSRTLDTVQLVNCFVSIVLGIQSQQIASAIDNVQDRVHVNIKDTLERERRRRMRGLQCKLIPVLIVAGLVVVLLVELLDPGSMYRYWRCRRGSIAGHTASFRFSTYDHQYPVINGVEFTWPALKKKAGLESVDPYNATGYHCYLNLDRCAYGGVYLKREPQIRGPLVFIVNSTCTGVLYEEKNVWKYYTSAERIKCTPAYS